VKEAHYSVKEGKQTTKEPVDGTKERLYVGTLSKLHYMQRNLKKILVTSKKICIS
jgi:hypothetical protein